MTFSKMLVSGQISVGQQVEPQLPEYDALATNEEYRALMRALRRKRGFGLFFVQASPVKGQEILADLRRDLPQKRVAEITLIRTDERLFDQLEAVWEREKVDIFWIEGLEQSLLAYEDIQRLAGWDEQDLITYSWKDVPPILSHLNLGRERFEAKFNCVLMFVVPLFVVKYLLRRAGDFFDWKSGFFEFPDDQMALAERVIEDGDYNEYLRLGAVERFGKILQIKDLLGAPTIETDRRTKLLQEMGQLFRAGKEYEEAITSYDHALALNADFLRAWNNKGFALRELGRYEQAVEAHKFAIALKPKRAISYTFLGHSYYDQESYDNAAAAYKRSIELNYGAYFPIFFWNFHVEKHLSAFSEIFTLIICWLILPISRIFSEWEMDDLFPLLDAVIKSLRFKKQGLAYYWLGVAYASQKNYEQAVIAYKCSIALNPTAYNYGSLGNIHETQENYKCAIDAYTWSLKFDPNLKQTFSRRGEAYRLMQRYDEALKDFDRAIKLDSEYDWAIASRGQTYKLLEDYEKALTDFNRAIELDSEYDWAIASRGLTYKALERYEEALIDFNRAIELKPTAWRFGQRGETYRLVKHYEDALKDFDRAVELNPKYAGAFANRGKTYRLIRRYEEALKDFDRAIELDNEYNWAIGNRGEMYLQLNQIERAIEDFNHLIKLDYEDEWAYYLRAIARLKLNQPELAETDLQQAIFIAQVSYEKDSIDWLNTFNLALYHLAAAHPEESDRLYTSNLTAPIKNLEEAITDLDDFLHLFPDHTQAQQVKQLLQGTIEATQPIAL